MPTRREFLSKAGATVTLLMIPIGCSNESPAPDAGGGGQDSGGAKDVTQQDNAVQDVAAPKDVATETGPTCGANTTSTTVAAHTHTLCVLAADLASPPSNGATYTSSSSPDPDANNTQHTHTVSFTAAQLTTINGGGTVTVTSAISLSHTHDFAVKKA
jgi:hypothetical protein